MRVIRTIAARIVEAHLSQSTAMPFDNAGGTMPSFLSRVVNYGRDWHSPPEYPHRATNLMIDQVLAFLGAGHETIAGAASWVCDYLRLHSLLV